MTKKQMPQSKNNEQLIFDSADIEKTYQISPSDLLRLAHEKGISLCVRVPEDVSLFTIGSAQLDLENELHQLRRKLIAENIPSPIQINNIVALPLSPEDCLDALLGTRLQRSTFSKGYTLTPDGKLQQVTAQYAEPEFVSRFYAQYAES